MSLRRPGARHRERRLERELTALADGRLPARRRRRVERAVARSPELQADLRAQRRALAALHRVAAQPAPIALRARLELAHPPTRRAGAGAGRRNISARIAPALAATVAGAAAVAVILLGAGGGPEAPTVAEAAALGQRPAQAVAPVADRHRILVHLRAAGLGFPYWEDRFDYAATGVRHDRLAGRRATTVYYARGNSAGSVAYTIVSGPALAPTASARSTVQNGTVMHTFTAGGSYVVTWLRRGHTCVLTGTGTSPATLLRLAAWRAGGQIPY